MRNGRQDRLQKFSQRCGQPVERAQCVPATIIGTVVLRPTPQRVDAFSLNYRVMFAEEGCFDRSEASHAVSLCDMHAKYGDVISTAEILSYFAQLPNKLFDLPAAATVPRRGSKRWPNKLWRQPRSRRAQKRADQTTCWPVSWPVGN
jgi:hypothetical protein